MALVLVIEDNPTNRKLIRDILRRGGHNVVEATNALEGIRQAGNLHPDLIVMDIQLPGMDGLSATRELKGAESTRHIPVLALTAHAMSGDGERFLEGGCDAYLAKPLRYAEFLDVVGKLLNSAPPDPFG